MKEIQDLVRYFREVLGIEVRAKAFKKDLPFFLTETYHFYEFFFMRKRVVLAVAKEEFSPNVAKKHFQKLREKVDGLCIYVRLQMSSYHRNRFIQCRIPFVVPGNQMYVPDLAIDLREHFRQLSQKRTLFSPAAQAVVLYACIHGEQNERFTPSMLAQKLHYTPMTMTRALNELEALNIGEIERKGKERFLRFPNRSTIGQQAHRFMNSPVQKRKWIQLNHQGSRLLNKWGVMAGLSALAKQSSLNPPTCPVYAIDATHWNLLKKHCTELPFPEEADVELELWKYDPMLFAKHHLVDPISLYLSCSHAQDERVEQALESLLKQYLWSKD